MIASILQGVLIGLSLAILTGPLLFAIVHATMNYGKKAGLVLTSGIWISDLLYIIGLYWMSEELEAIVDNTELLTILGVIGSLIVIGIGVFIWRKPNKDTTTSQVPVNKNRLWFSGFALNTFNAFTLIFWASIMLNYIFSEAEDSTHTSLFISGIFITIVITDTIKVFAAAKIKEMLSIQTTSVFNKVAGILFILIGIAMLLKAVGIF